MLEAQSWAGARPACFVILLSSAADPQAGAHLQALSLQGEHAWSSKSHARAWAAADSNGRAYQADLAGSLDKTV